MILKDVIKEFSKQPTAMLTFSFFSIFNIYINIHFNSTVIFAEIALKSISVYNRNKKKGI